MKEIQDKINQFNIDRDWDQFHSPENLSKSIAIEASELLECFQWSTEYNKEAVREELADVLIYCFQLAHKLDVDIKDIMLDKIAKNEKKYPIEKSKGNSKKYIDL